MKAEEKGLDWARLKWSEREKWELDWTKMKQNELYWSRGKVTELDGLDLTGWK